MDRTLLNPLLAVALFAATALLAPSVAGNPCATPCGQVAIVTDCLSAVVTGEGTTTLNGIVWTFEAYEVDGSVRTTVTPASQTGSTATFAVPFTRDSLARPWYLGGTLYANGVPVASHDDWCLGSP